MHEAELRSQAKKMGVDSIKQANSNENAEFKIAKVKIKLSSFHSLTYVMGYFHILGCCK